MHHAEQQASAIQNTRIIKIQSKNLCVNRVLNLKSFDAELSVWSECFLRNFSTVNVVVSCESVYLCACAYAAVLLPTVTAQ